MVKISKNGRRKKSKSCPLDGDTSLLPSDIVESILSMLPVKSLMRYKSVSKPWYSLISDSQFARLHLEQSKKKSDSGTLLMFGLPKFCFLKFTNNGFKLEKLEFPLKKYSKAEVLCTCDGLILLKNMRPTDKMYVLWNPSTRTYTKFSCPYQVKLFGDLYGFCHDASSFTNDYKFVLTLSNCCYAVYSYKNKSWIEKQEDPNSPDRIMWDKVLHKWRHGLFVNGALHWIMAKTRKDSTSTSKISYCSLGCVDRHYVDCRVFAKEYNNTYEVLCFDPKDDKFKTLSKPACFDIRSIFMLTNLGGKLCLYQNTNDCKMIDIWMMKEYGDFKSWMKLLSIENVSSIMHHATLFSIVPLCLTNKSDVILYFKGSGLVVYNPEKKKFSKVHIYGAYGFIFKDSWYTFFPELCWNDSLALPNRF